MLIVFTSSAVDRGFDPWLGHTKDYKIGIYCFSGKHVGTQHYGVKANTDWLGIRIICPS